MADQEMSSVVCTCGETLTAPKAGKNEPSELERKYRKHLARPDHQNSPAQWAEAYDRNEKARERAKAKSARGAEGQ
jgi:hypothetical protein